MRGARTAAAIVATLVAATATTAASAPRSPALRIGFVGGVKVTGVRFAPRERVKVTFASAGTWRRSIRTTTAGRFTLTLEGASVDRCQGYVATARGARGDTATLKVMPLACAPE